MILNDKTSSGRILGRVLLIEQNDLYVYNQRTERIQVWESEYCSQFLYQFLNSDLIRSKIINSAQGNTQIYVNWSSICEFSYFIPLCEEQTLIGNFFKQVDEVIHLLGEELSKYKNLKKAYLAKMFPKEGEKVPELRFPGFSGEWEEKKLGEVARFINGRAYKQEELLKNGKYKVLRVGNFYTNDSWYYSDLELEEKYFANIGDLLYTWSATFGPHIWNGDKVIYHYHIWKIELTSLAKKEFFVQLLDYDKEKILSNKNGSTMVHITKSGIEEKRVSMPLSIKEQTLIGNFFKEMDETIELKAQELEKYKDLKRAYLAKMFV